MIAEMTISVKLFGVLRDRLPCDAERGRMEMLVPAGSAAGAVLTRLGISSENAGHLVVLVNGRQVGLDQVLKEGDVLSAFPALAGG